MLENRMVEDDYIETNNDYDSYLEHLLEKDDEYYEEEIYERLSEDNARFKFVSNNKCISNANGTKRNDRRR